MREIKFRAWDKNREEMNITVSGLTGIDNPNNDDPLKYVCGNKNVIDWKDCELMQYTGLKDKNGKESYLGDITFTEDGEFSKTCEICCIEEYLEFFLKDIYTSDTYSLEEIGDFEIIGNIYENKELIK